MDDGVTTEMKDYLVKKKKKNRDERFADYFLSLKNKILLALRTSARIAKIAALESVPDSTAVMCLCRKEGSGMRSCACNAWLKMQCTWWAGACVEC